jgi:hypothetical protein
MSGKAGYSRLRLRNDDPPVIATPWQRLPGWQGVDTGFAGPGDARFGRYSGAGVVMPDLIRWGHFDLRFGAADTFDRNAGPLPEQPAIFFPEILLTNAGCSFGFLAFHGHCRPSIIVDLICRDRQSQVQIKNSTTSPSLRAARGSRIKKPWQRTARVFSRFG